MKTLKDLTNHLAWKFFNDLTQIPRASGKEQQVSAYLKNFAKEHHFECLEDSARNLLIKVPATKGKEANPCVMLQGHTDMVTEKNENTIFNFDTDAIETYIDANWLRTKGTTLGADNGIGVAMALAAAVDPQISHGPLELLFTVEEETGLGGASDLQIPSQAKYLLNIDSEEEGSFYIGCAGGAQIEISSQQYSLESSYESLNFMGMKLYGFRGGHSGLNIIENRGNANRLLIQFLAKLNHKYPYHLSSFQGGTKHNAISRESTATIATTHSFELIQKEAHEFLKQIQQEYSEMEKEISFDIYTSTIKSPALTQKSTTEIIHSLNSFPHGILAMTMNFDKMVETSCNFAKVNFNTQEGLHILMSVRSTVQESLYSAVERILSLCQVLHFQGKDSGFYPPWRPYLESSLLQKAKECWKSYKNKEAEVKSIHAGLECGILLEKYPQMEALSFGPDIKGAHSPTECLCISSTESVYEFLKKLLSTL